MTTRGTSTTLQSNTVYTRTIGNANFETAARLDVATVLQAVRKKRTLARHNLMQVAEIPQKTNELAQWRKRNHATGAIYQIKDGGVQASTATLGYDLTTEAGVSHTANAIVPSITLDGDYVTATPNKYGIVYRGTVGALSASLDDPQREAIEEIGYGIVGHCNYRVKSLFDSNAVTLFPAANLTALSDVDWTSSNVIDYNSLLKLRAYLDAAGFEPAGGAQNFRMDMGSDSMVQLLNDSKIQNLVQYGGVRRDPVPGVYNEAYLSGIAGFDIGVSPTITTNLTLNSVANKGAPVYIWVKDAIGTVSMADERVGGMPNVTPDSEDPGKRASSTAAYPNPVSIIRKGPGENGFDDFNEQWSVAAKWTSVYKQLYSTRLIRFVHHVGTIAGDIGTAGAVNTESALQTAATGAV